MKGGKLKKGNNKDGHKTKTEKEAHSFVTVCKCERRQRGREKHTEKHTEMGVQREEIST